jgi:hypothetical protein
VARGSRTGGPVKIVSEPHNHSGVRQAIIEWPVYVAGPSKLPEESCSS